MYIHTHIYMLYIYIYIYIYCMYMYNIINILKRKILGEKKIKNQKGGGGLGVG